MLDLKWIRQFPEKVQGAINVKKVDLDLQKLLSLDQKVLSLKRILQEKQQEKNVIAKRIPTLDASLRPAEVEKGRALNGEIAGLNQELAGFEKDLLELLYKVPNIPSPDAPIGNSEADNVEVMKVGQIREFDFEPLDHVDLMHKNQWGDFEQIASVCRSRSYMLEGDLVLLEWALISYCAQVLQQKGFRLISVPAMVNQEALFASGHFPLSKDQTYECAGEEVYLSGTSEVVVNSLYAGKILQHQQLPLKFVSFSACFRKEAGSAGRDVRGLMRVHQFQKVEQFIIGENSVEASLKYHAELLDNSRKFLEDFQIPYRVIECCTADMGLGKFKMHDIESYVPSEKRYRETHSCSSLLDWQARRAQLRYKDAQSEIHYCHTLNNTAIASPRLLIPLLENHQQKDGSVWIPPVLRPWMGGREFMGGKK